MTRVTRFSRALLVFVGMLAADQATSQSIRNDTTPCREVGPAGTSGSHTSVWFETAEACRQEWRRAHGTYRIPDSYRGPSQKPRGEGSGWFYSRLP